MLFSESSDSTKTTTEKAEITDNTAVGKSPEPRSGGNSLAIKLVCYLLRLVTGGVFVFSGFVKAVDPWGGLYKISDYFNAWGVDIAREPALMLACLLATFEFVLGIMIVLGAYRRTAPILALVFMAVMTMLTLYIWIADPVSDCGCFGDALVIDNSVTFWKNVVLLALVILLVLVNRRTRPLVRPALQWLALVLTGAYIISVQMYGYNIQPMIDFRPWPVGTEVSAIAANDGEDDGLVLIYEKGGRRQTFTVDSLPDDTWTFVARGRTEAPSAAKSSLSVFDHGEDVTDLVFDEEGTQYILIVSDPKRYGMSRGEMANRLYDYAEQRGEGMFAVVAVGDAMVDDWKEMTGAQYPVYTAEDTDLKMLARGDAALVTVRDGKIADKTNIFALPPEFPETGNHEPTAVTERHSDPLLRLTLVWLTLMVLLYLVPRYRSVFQKKK